ncbi:hypothetical protein [Streptomyces sp. NBC_01306]|uniref:hypothetical protein n=1 Tax=Streptomyces sp. NBC_01306 TaxID=2903819 RepID=UPI002253F4B6|nr:hypothetical protein [Streptomyces sp. NBC_01306]MCX4729332.1 hypothetical protein [Streptomyces sp. NBC_01306]
MDATQRESEAARSASRRRMILLAPVWGPVFIVVGAKAVLQEMLGAERPASGGTAPLKGGLSRFPLVMTAGLTMVFAAVFSTWLALGLPPEGLARIPVALVAASLASSLLFFPMVLVAAALVMGAVEKKARRASSE